MENDDDENRQPRPRRYKDYLEPNNMGTPVPSQTQWSMFHPAPNVLDDQGGILDPNRGPNFREGLLEETDNSSESEVALDEDNPLQVHEYQDGQPGASRIQARENFLEESDHSSLHSEIAVPPQAANEGSSDSYFVESNASSQSESDAEENEQQESAEDSSQSDQDNAQQQNNLHQAGDEGERDDASDHSQVSFVESRHSSESAANELNEDNALQHNNLHQSDDEDKQDDLGDSEDSNGESRHSSETDGYEDNSREEQILEEHWDNGDSDSTTLIQEQEDEAQAVRENENEDHEMEPRVNTLKARIEKDQYLDQIQDAPAASRAEVLLNILEFSTHYNLPVQANEDLHKLVNSIFYKPIIPDTKYKIDKLYANNSEITFYFFCGQCSENFGSLDHKDVQVKLCPNCGFNNPVSDLTKASYYIIINLASQLEALFSNPDVAKQLKNPFVLVNNHTNVMRDLYDGEVYQNFVKSLNPHDADIFLSMTFCTDGTPLFSTSTVSIWPIYVIIHELPPRLRMANTLLAGLWFHKHPVTEMFLDGFVDAVLPLSNPGFNLKIGDVEKSCKLYLLGCCVDSAARGAVQCIHAHNGEFGCNWCLHPGETAPGSSVRKYLIMDEPFERRTKEGVLADGRVAMNLTGRVVHVNGVLGLSPLLRVPHFNIIDGMILDVLHWSNLGIGRQMFKIWLGERKCEDWDPVKPPAYYIGGPENLKLLNARIKAFTPPIELRRTPRDISHFAVWTGREFENMILYLSIPLLKNILPDRYLKHWSLYVQAKYILMGSELNTNDFDLADELMKKFTSGVQELYGWTEMTFNMHLNEHASEHAKRWGPLCCMSAYAFEAANKDLKGKIHAERGIPHQVIRRLGFDISLLSLREVASTAQSERFRTSMKRKEILKSFYVGPVNCMMPSNFNPSREESWLCQQKGIEIEKFSECKRIIENEVCYSCPTTAKTDNSFAVLSNGSIVKIRKVICSEELLQVFLFVSKVHCTPYPSSLANCRSSPFLYNVQLIEAERSLVEVSELKMICVSNSVNDVKFRGHLLTIVANHMNTF